MAAFNVIQFRKETRKSVNSFKNIAFNAAALKFRGLKEDLLSSFEDHEVTQEVENGPEGSNVSGTLGGKGNLFSFIGFEKGEKPLEVIRSILRGFEMDKAPQIEGSGSKVLFRFKVKMPTLEEIYKSTPLPWESGRSWVKGIERGISGFGHYMYWKTLPDPPSRSGAGVQVDNILRGGAFSPRSYLSKIINDFKKELK